MGSSSSPLIVTRAPAMLRSQCAHRREAHLNTPMGRPPGVPGVRALVFLSATICRCANDD